MKRLLVLTLCLIATCSPLPAQNEPSTPQLMVPLENCERELLALDALHQQQLEELSTDSEKRLAKACEAAAADAVRPLLADIAGLRAERDSWRRIAGRRVFFIVAGVFAGVLAGWTASQVWAAVR